MVIFKSASNVICGVTDRALALIRRITSRRRMDDAFRLLFDAYAIIFPRRSLHYRHHAPPQAQI